MSDAVTALHVHSGYSLLRGSARLETLLARAGELGHSRLALTDVNNLYGATRFHRLARERGIRPLIGAELSEAGLSAVTLVEEQCGYENLCRLITRIHRRTGRGPQLATDLAELSDGLHVIVTDPSLAGELARVGLSRERLWLGVDPATQSFSLLRRLGECSRRFGLSPVATGSALLAGADQRPAARLLAAIRTGSTFDTVPAAALPNARAVLRSSRQLRAELADFADAVAANRRLVERCSAFSLLPRRPIFPAFPAPPGRTPQGYLRHLCEEGMVRRYGPGLAPSRAQERLKRELSLIERMGFCEYFLVVWDIVQYARRSGAPVAGRGSGASSLVAYLLGITNVCPLRYNIPFERFLHERREDFPDLDVDFCWRIRDDVIGYAFRRWGERHVAMVSVHTTFQPRSAVRETAKAFGLSNEQISNFERIAPTADRSGRAKIAICGLDRERSERILALATKLVGLPHNLSVHPGGIVISPGAIDRTAPIETAAKGVKITQYDKDGVEDIGLVKLDLLGNRNLSTIRAACRAIRERHGRWIDIEKLPPADAETVALLRSARTVGCNQIESPAMRHLLKMMRPASTHDVMKLLALIRPGAASIGMKETFIRRHRGLEAPPPGDPRVDAVLGETYGVMLYEDDVMLVASAMLGCSLSEADGFRRAVQKCTNDAERLKLSREFLARCVENGIDLDYAKSIWVQMAKYNAYSFCRAHAASYAMLAYGGAYLKAHWPAEFYLGALNNNQSMYHPRVYVEQARRDGVRFVLPDANRSGEEFTFDGEAIRVGLNCVSSLGPAGVDEILRCRRRRAFESLSDFLGRVRIGEQEVRSLILCGAFDSFGRPRPALMMELNLFGKLASARGANQPTLFSATAVIPAPPGDYSENRKYFDERRILGLSVRGHVMSIYRTMLNRSVGSRSNAIDIDSRRLESARNRRVRIAGVLEARRTTRTERGETMAFLTLDDEYGLFEVTLFPDICRSIRCDFSRYGPYIVTGKVEDQYDSLSITADGVEYFDVARAAGRHPTLPTELKGAG